MFETLINPKKAERKPWELFLVGLFYASFAVLLVNWIFLPNPVFSRYSGILIITFTVMLSLPFMYFTIKREEEKDIRIKKEGLLIKKHGKALAAFAWLFLGFVVAFSLWYLVLPETMGQSFYVQIEQYCAINSPNNFDGCVSKYSGITTSSITSSIPFKSRALDIFFNNLGVLLFCILFSLAFGAGAIFILTWNASVIATAVGIFGKTAAGLPAGLARYMIHGLPEIGAYFVAGLAGGIISVAIIRHDFKSQRFWHVLHDSLTLIALAIALLVLGVLLEIFVTPALF